MTSEWLFFHSCSGGLPTFPKPEFSTLGRVLGSPKLLTEKNQEPTITYRSSY